MSQSPTSSSGRGTLAYALASALANVLGYVVSILLVRRLPPAEFGAIGALLSLGIIGTIPASAVQLGVAKATSRSDTEGRPSRNSVARGGLLIGGALAGGFALVAVPVSDYLHLGRPIAVAVLGLTLIPMMATAALQGAQLGEHRLGGLAASTTSSATARVVAVVVALSVWPTTVGILTVMALGAWVPAVLTLLLTPPGGRQRVGLRSLFSATSHGTAMLTAYFLTTNLDIPMARHHLSGGASGAYVLGSLFTKICLWGPQFISVVAFTRMHHAAHGRRATIVACALTAALGLAAVGLSVPFGRAVLKAFTGHSRDPQLVHLAPWFGTLGVLWAVLHTVVLHEIANRRAREFWWLWVMALAMAGWISTLPIPTTIGHVLGTVLWVSAAAVGVALVRLATERSRGVGDAVGPSTEELLADGNQNL